MPGINGFDLGMKFREHADKMDVTFVKETVTAIHDRKETKQVETASGTSYEARTLILATGAEHTAATSTGRDGV